MDVSSQTIAVKENRIPNTIPIVQVMPVWNPIEQEHARSGDQICPSLNDAASTTPSRYYLHQKLFNDNEYVVDRIVAQG